jgi:photosystem II stability/assembly factor-like uncharacterized protein
MTRRFLPILVLFSLLMPTLAGAQRPPADAVPDRPGTSKPWLRLDWLYKPRAFPNAEVPRNAWHDAWLQKKNLPTWHPRPQGIGIEALGTWEHMGPNATNPGAGLSWTGRVHAIAVNPADTNIIYIGHAKGGVWKTTDGGTTWTNLTDTLSTQTVGCLTLDPSDPNIVYFGTGEEYYAGATLGGVGIWKSTDGGATWTLKGNSTFAGHRINAISIDPSNTNRWAVSSDGGFYTTTDAGANFVLRKSGVGSALDRHPVAVGVLYGAMGWPFGGATAAQNGVYKSTDNGVTWTPLAGPPSGANAGRYELSICRGTPSVIYAVCTVPASVTNQYKMQGVWKSIDDGATWSQVANTASFPNSWAQGWYDLAIKADPNNPAICYVADVVVYKTINSGSTWTKLPDPGNHPDIHALEVLQSDSNKVYLGEDSGFYVSTNGGTTWTHKNSNRGTMEYYALDVHPTNPLLLAAGAQDNSTHVRTVAGGSTFDVRIGGDGFWTAYKQSDPLIMLGEYQYGNIFRSTDGGTTWGQVLGLSSEAQWSVPIVNDPTNPNNFYAATWVVRRSPSSGATGTWTVISGDVTKGTGYVTDIKIAPSNGNYIYVSADDGGYSVSTNGGSTWTARFAGLPNAAVGCAGVDPNNPLVCYAGILGFTAGQHVFKSVDAGATWSNITGNLPNVPVNSLAAHPTEPNTLFAATDNSVYVTTDGGASWAIAGTGLPNTMCTMLRVNATTGYLSASTYGRGTWRLALGSSAAATALTVADIAGQIGGTVSLKATLTSGGAGVNGKTVEFKVNGAAVGNGTTNASGVATRNFTITETLGTGAFAIAGKFAGDSGYSTSSGSGTLTSSKADTTVAMPDVTGVPGQTVTLRASLSRNSDGAFLSGKTIAFSVNGTALGTAATNASGEASKSYLIPLGTAAGDLPMVASFAGDTNHNADDGNGTLQVRTKTTLTVTSATGYRLGSVILRATLKFGTTVLPGKSVRFRIAGVDVGSAVTDSLGKAALTHPVSEAVGAYSLKAEFDGDATYHSSVSNNGTLTIKLAITKLTVSALTALYNSTVNLKAILKVGTTPIAGRSVSFTIDGIGVGSATTDAAGIALLPHSVTESIGGHTIGTSYAGDGVDYAPCTATGTLKVQSLTKIVGENVSAPAGSSVVLGAVLTRTSDNTALEGRTLKFYIGTTFVASGVTDATGRATVSVTAPGVGVTTIYSIKFTAETYYRASTGKGTVKGT